MKTVGTVLIVVSKYYILARSKKIAASVWFQLPRDLRKKQAHTGLWPSQQFLNSNLSWEQAIKVTSIQPKTTTHAEQALQKMKVVF